MNAETAIKPSGLELLRAKFPPDQISKLPKPTKKDAPKGRCNECGGWHGLPAVHLDYVGHAALTNRLLDADPHWTWEPVAFDDRGLPARDQNGGLWIKLTVCGVTRLGYGSADGKSGGDAIKELIGDALRNAAMRFGAALDLWHKGDLHASEDEAPAGPPMITADQRLQIAALSDQAKVPMDDIRSRAKVKDIAELTEEAAASVIKKLKLTIDQRRQTTVEDVLNDEVPY